MENAATKIAKPFEYEFDLAQKQSRLIELDAKLKTGEHFNKAVGWAGATHRKKGNRNDTVGVQATNTALFCHEIYCRTV